MRARWRAILLVGMGLAGAIVLVAIILTLGEANRQRDRALAMQTRSYDVMILARTLSATMARSEASLGRYVISGDKQLGQLYFEDWRRASGQIERLSRLTARDAAQRARVARLRAAFDTRGAELSLIALSTNYGKNNQALGRFYRAREAAALDGIDDALDGLIGRERVLLEERTATAMATVARSSRAAGVLAVFGVAIVLGAIALGWLTVRVTAQRASAEAAAAAERERAEELALAVAETSETLRAQSERLNQSQKMEAVGQLTGGIAHDFNNMLAVVLGGLELARRALGTGDAAVRRHLDHAAEGADRAAALTRRLLAFAREQAINPEPIAAAAMVAGVRELLDRTLGDGVIVAVVDESDGWRIRADRVQLENTLVNLAVNARDAMAGRGRLTIRTYCAVLAEGEHERCQAGEHVAIAVADTGSGMSEAVAARVFEPFFTTKPVGKGTGLGLSQAFGFVRQSGGCIAIRTAPGAGTTVTLFLPREASVAEVPAQAAPEAPAHEATAALTVLVVEDDPRVLAATTGALDELGHRVIGCADPLAAPALLDAHPAIGLIVTDVLMPAQTGPEMIAALPPRHAAIPVLYVTGFAGEGGAVDFGGRPVLRKPFTLVALERAVARAVATGAEARDAAE